MNNTAQLCRGRRDIAHYSLLITHYSLLIPHCSLKFSACSAVFIPKRKKTYFFKNSSITGTATGGFWTGSSSISVPA